jgi:hypothetical protein
MAVRRIISEEGGVGRARDTMEAPPPVEVRTDRAEGKFESRAPPAHSDNGP